MLVGVSFKILQHKPWGRGEGATSSDGILAADLANLAEGINNRSKKPKALQGSTEHGSGEEPSAEDDDEESEGPEPKRGKWFDEDKQVNGALRKFQVMVESLREQLVTTNKHMLDSIEEVRSVPSEAAMFESEMTLVDKRRKWLQVCWTDPVT